MKGWFVPLLITFLLGITSSRKSYDGHQVWRVNIKNAQDKTSIRNIVIKYNLDVWSDTKSHVDIRVSPDEKYFVQDDLALSRLQYETLIPDAEKLIKEIEPKEYSTVSFDKYNSYWEIQIYLEDIAEYNENATLITLAEGYEFSPLYQLKFSVGSGKPAVWFDFNIHAREFMTGQVGVYGAHIFDFDYGNDPLVTAVLDKYDVYITAVANPDGYAFGWSQDPFWRKNRNEIDGSSCMGIDLDRNFDDHFGEVGSSEDPCLETYRGPSPASEVETQGLQNSILDLAANADLRAVFSVHAYSQRWMYPYGWTDEELPPNVDELERVAKIGVEALAAVHGTQYEIGPVASSVYPVSGTTADFAYNHGINYSYTLELRDRGDYGYYLPTDQILPTARETWAGLLAATLAI